MAGQSAVPGAGSSRIGLEDVDVTRLGMAALRLVRVIEQGDIGRLWDAASTLVRTSLSRAEFIGSLTTQRRALGWGTERRWTAVRIDRAREGSALPPGTYAVIEFTTRLGEGRLRYREQVTLRYEDDGVWRLAGYQTRPD